VKTDFYGGKIYTLCVLYTYTQYTQKGLENGLLRGENGLLGGENGLLGGEAPTRKPL